MTFPYGETLTIITRTKTGVDDYGDPIYTDSTITAIGAISPAIGIETLGSGDQTSIEPRASFMGAEADRVSAVLTSTSAIARADGKTFEVDDEPLGTVVNPFTGWRAGITVPLKRVTG